MDKNVQQYIFELKKFDENRLKYNYRSKIKSSEPTTSAEI